MKNNHFYYLEKLFFTSHKRVANSRTRTVLFLQDKEGSPDEGKSLKIDSSSSGSSLTSSPTRPVVSLPNDGDGSPKRRVLTQSDSEGRMTPIRLKKVHSFIGPMQEGSKLTQFQIRDLTGRIEKVKTMEALMEVLKGHIGIDQEKPPSMEVLKKPIGINPKKPPSSPRTNIFDSLLKNYQTFQEKGGDENQLKVSKRVLQILISNESDIIDHIPISPIKQDDMPNDDLEIYILMRMLNRIKLDSAGMKDDEVFNSFFENLGSRLAELNVAFKAVKPSIQQTDLDLLILRIKKTIILLINLLKFDSNSLDASSSKALDYSYLLMDLTNKHLIKHGKASLKVIQNLFSITWELIQTHIDFELVDTHEHLFLRKNRKEFTTKLLLENQTVIINTVEKMDGFFNDLFILKKLQEQATESDLITHAGIIKIAKQFNQYENKLSVFLKKSKQQEDELIKQISVLNVLARLKEELIKLNELMNGFDMPVSLKEKVAELNKAMIGLDMPVSLKDKVVELNEAMSEPDMSVSLKDKVVELNEAINGILDKSELALLSAQFKACQNFNKISHRKLSLFIWALHGVKLSFPYPNKFDTHKTYYDDLYVNQSILVLLNAILDDIADQAQMPRAVELAISIFPDEKSKEMDQFYGNATEVKAHLIHEIDNKFQEFIPVKDELIDYLVFSWQIYTDSFESFTRGIHNIYYIKKLERVFELSVNVAEKLSKIISEDDFPTFDVTPEQKIGLKIFFEELDYSLRDKKGLKDDISTQFEDLGIKAKRERSQSMVEKETILRRLVTSSSLIFNNFLVGAQFNKVPNYENALLFKVSAPHNMNMIAFAQMVTIYNHAFAGIPVKDTNDFLARKEINDLLAYNQRLGRIGNNIATALTRELKEDCDFSGVVDILSDLLAGVWPDHHTETIGIIDIVSNSSNDTKRKEETGELVKIFDQIDARAYMNDSYITTLSQYEAQLFEVYAEIDASLQKTKSKIEKINSESLVVLLEFIMDSERFKPILVWTNDKKKEFESDLTKLDKRELEVIKEDFFTQLGGITISDINGFNVGEQIGKYFKDIFDITKIGDTFWDDLEMQVLKFYRHYSLKQTEVDTKRYKTSLELTFGPMEPADKPMKHDKVNIKHILGLYMLHRMCKTII